MAVPTFAYTSDFTRIDNGCFRDDRLGYEALAIFTYLRSKPADWKVMQTELAKRFKSGRDRVRNAINELVEYGYVRKVQSRTKTGLWNAADYVVLARPDAPLPDQPSPDQPAPENRSLLTTDLLPTTDSTKEDNIHSAACAAYPSDRDCSPPALPEESKESGNDGTRIDLPRSSNEDRYPRIYRQSPAEAARAWDELRRMDDWQSVWGDDEMTHWHALLRKGYAADDIVDVAMNFILKTPPLDVPSLGDFLQCFDSYLDVESRWRLKPLRQQHPHHAHA
jgi:hypothetical protein